MNKDKPTLWFCVGIPGSGKSYWSETHKDELNATIHSSDAIREEFGDVNDQSKNELVFSTLHKRIKEDLIVGKNVLFDSTGLKRKNRLHFLRQIQNIPCKKICVLFATPVEICKSNNANRERKVPEEVIERMLKSFDVPCKQEGWDNIQIIWWDWKKEGLEYYIFSDVCEWTKIPQNNKHHSLSVGGHMIETAYQCSERYHDKFPKLYLACLMHDCAKPIVKGFIDSKGNPSAEAHYFGHDHYGSYQSLFYLKEFPVLNDEDILYISLLINLHMSPFVWDKSGKAKEKDRRLFGDDIISDIELLHECDVAVH